MSNSDKKGITEKVVRLIKLAKKNHQRILKLSGLSIVELPEEIVYLDELEFLNLSNNQIKHLPKNFDKLQKLIGLNVSNNLFEAVSDEIFSIKNIKYLDLSNNNLKAVSVRLAELQNLERLDIGLNLLTEYPIALYNLTKLSTLCVDSNYINAFPSEINRLQNLERLNAGWNGLKVLPNEIGDLKNLRELSLSDNPIIDILIKIDRAAPEKVGRHTRLSVADFTDEDDIIRVGALGRTNEEKRDYRRNDIQELPSRFQQLKLSRLDLEGNNLPIPPEILAKIYEPEKVINYYFSIKRKQLFYGAKALNELKLIFIGQGSVGKTSVIQQILHGIFDQNQNKTEGISINQWELKGEGEIKGFIGDSSERFSIPLFPIRLNIWDFGGQEIMHATHQFFLTKRSLYLLVLDARLTQEENRVEYWLKIIQSFGGESPVLIVGNKTDQHPLDIDRTGLQKKYPNIVGILETSAATGAGIAALKTEIAKQVDVLPHVRDLLPETWFTVKSKLEELGRDKNFITQDEYLGLCGANDVTDETSQHTLIGFLHDLGVVLHFQDDPRLEALGILNPLWVTNGVYKILNAHELFQNQGQLTLPMLNKILDLPEYPNTTKRLYIVDMMKKFELCYAIETDKTFLVPDLLPKDEPSTDGREDALAFQYHYTVLPSSVITRFIVRMNEFVHKKVWRSGVVLKDGGSTALVKADTEDRKVFIWVSGDAHKRHDFLSKIRGQFDAIHKTISKLEVKEMVPVPAHPEAEPVDYDLLLQMEHNNVEAYPVLSGGKMIVVKVREMLSGVARQEDRQRGNITNIYVGGDVGGNIVTGDDNQTNFESSNTK